MVATLALPPAHIFPALVPAFAGLIWLTSAAPSRRMAFGAGWWFGLGYFAVGLYWIAFALLTDAARFGWLVPFAVLGLAGAFALYVGLVTLALHVSRARGLAAVLFFAVFWTAGEYLRGVLFTGFPWNLVGHTWAFSDAMSQSS